MKGVWPPSQRRARFADRIRSVRLQPVIMTTAMTSLLVCGLAWRLRLFELIEKPVVHLPELGLEVRPPPGSGEARLRTRPAVAPPGHVLLVYDIERRAQHLATSSGSGCWSILGWTSGDVAKPVVDRAIRESAADTRCARAS